ncbi:hypothetical protein [Flavobacterium sp.]|uniref:hypothetical protein n=1 Tax=Flavobacterium sp. TaxID=239 RepID=UPI0037534822
MKAIIYYLSFIIVSFYSCQGQEKNSQHTIVKIQSIKNSIKCKNYKDNFVFNFPDILGKNENNFFNNIIIKDYTSYLDLENKLITPKKLIAVAIDKRKKECENNNFSGFISSDYNITYNNGKLLSISMNYESLAGSINVDSYYYNFDVEQQKILKYSDVLKEDKTNELVKMCNKILNDRLKNLYTESKDELDESDVYKSLIDSKAIFNKANLNSFSLQENGIVFIFNYGFPNGVFDIDNNLYFTYTDFQKYIKEDFQKKLGK